MDLYQYNVETILWYLIFLGAIPVGIVHYLSFNHLKYYLPTVDLIANSFSSAGNYKGYFNNLYSTSPNNYLSFFSTNFINLIALLGVSFNAIEKALETGNFISGFRTSLIMYLMTYLLPTQIIPLITQKVQKMYDKDLDITKKNEDLHIGAFLIAISFSLALVLIEAYLIKIFVID